jgi:hypothetical protein
LFTSRDHDVTSVAEVIDPDAIFFTSRDREGTSFPKVYAYYWGTLREGDQLENPGVDGRIILRWMGHVLD